VEESRARKVEKWESAKARGGIGVEGRGGHASGESAQAVKNVLMGNKDMVDASEHGRR